MNACPICRHTSETPLTGICDNCRNHLSRMLDEIHQSWLDAHACLQPATGGEGGGSSERKLGVNVASLSWVQGAPILGILHSWEQMIREERGLVRVALLKPLCLADTIRAAVAFQQAHLDWVRQQPWADDYYTEVRDLHHDGQVASRRFEDAGMRLECPGDMPDGSVCKKRLRLPKDPLALVLCRNCGTEWTQQRLALVAASTEGVEAWVSMEDARHYTNLPLRTLQRWAHDGTIRRQGQRVLWADVKRVRDERHAAAMAKAI